MIVCYVDELGAGFFPYVKEVCVCVRTRAAGPPTLSQLHPCHLFLFTPTKAHKDAPARPPTTSFTPRSLHSWCRCSSSTSTRRSAAPQPVHCHICCGQHQQQPLREHPAQARCVCAPGGRGQQQVVQLVVVHDAAHHHPTPPNVHSTCCPSLHHHHTPPPPPPCPSLPSCLESEPSLITIHTHTGLHT